MTSSLVSFHSEPQTSELLGRFFESTVGADLIRAGIDPYYWREGDHEVDYVFEYNSKLIAIEVKSGRNKKAKSLEVFSQKYQPTLVVFITHQNYAKFAVNPKRFIESLI